MEVVKTMEGGVSVIQVQIGEKTERRGRKPKDPLTNSAHSGEAAE